MIKKLDYSIVPKGFAHCFNVDCKQAAHCLRHQITFFIPSECWSVSTINPTQTTPEGDCTGFMADTPLIYAYGMDHLLDDITYSRAKELKRCLMNHFGRAYYYKLKRKEKCFTPEDQQYIKNLFLCYGVEGELKYDSYREGYNWDRQQQAQQ